MKIKWFKELIGIDSVELNAKLGLKIKSVTKGSILTGKTIETTDFDGSPILLPETKPGIELEFEVQPTAEQLGKLDILLEGMSREGGRTLITELDELKAKVAKLEKIR